MHACMYGCIHACMHDCKCAVPKLGRRSEEGVDKESLQTAMQEMHMELHGSKAPVGETAAEDLEWAKRIQKSGGIDASEFGEKMGIPERLVKMADQPMADFAANLYKCSQCGKANGVKLKNTTRCRC